MITVGFIPRFAARLGFRRVATVEGERRDPIFEPPRRDENLLHGQQRGLKPPPTIEPSLRDDTAPDLRTAKCAYSSGL